MSVTVIREGQCRSAEGTDLVPGDLVIIEAGNLIPADLRLIECAGLEINEAASTGESMGITKSSDAINGTELSVGDKLNMAFKGTQVNRGRGLAWSPVTASGTTAKMARC